MRDAFTAKLPFELRNLLDEVETAYGSFIGFRVLDPTQTTPMAISCNADEVAFLLPEDGSVNIGAAHHELLHLRRYLVDGVPAIGAPGAANRLRVGKLENELEHLIIVPDQAKSPLGTHDASKWIRETNKSWDIYEQGNFVGGLYNSSQWARIAWLQTILANDASLHKRGEDLLSASANLTRVSAFGAQAMALTPNKVALSRYVLSALRIPPAYVYLQTFHRNAKEFEITRLEDAK